jgi:hypothetical protein
VTPEGKSLGRDVIERCRGDARNVWLNESLGYKVIEWSDRIVIEHLVLRGLK